MLVILFCNPFDGELDVAVSNVVAVEDVFEKFQRFWPERMTVLSEDL